ncbi:MAG: histidinol-phosphatase [Phenylobacterium sp.]|uniref:histidinol-phosphatase n=1 Tax=Phenylobacterium sp. TaxID=1871053 RepID=UPI0025D3C9FC|nr:histidinol-phosphatase [Phenylobacterium sp.]MCA6245598.1 histidinol-phosphatase [Phenylobacterium sp.]MCA6254290.1 histidinol-phosphatase [Phenylobacterium sp.]MCA6305905.1 histidinol-phosphatase [Phenylobacterium sp.]
MMKPELIPGLEELLLDLNRVSAEVILPLFRSDHGLEDKGGETGFDPVTMADRGAEAAIRRRLAEVVPEHGVIGEEYGEDRPDREFVWVLDPVDGTRAFIAGLPVWTTLISLRWRGEPVLSSIGQPYLGEVFIGSPEGSRLVRGGESRPLRVRPCLGLSVATIASTDPIAYFGADEKAAWDRVRAAARLARLGCDAYAYAMVAAGAIDLVLESRACKCWDIEAAAPLLAGAGGVATDWNGMPIGLNGGQLVVAGDRACLDEALPLLKSAAD